MVCALVAALLHFFFLSSFCWVLTEAWQSYMAVTGRLRNRIIRKRFLCLGWGETASLSLSLCLHHPFFKANFMYLGSDLFPFHLDIFI